MQIDRYTHTHTHIYIYIERERERERPGEIYIERLNVEDSKKEDRIHVKIGVWNVLVGGLWIGHLEHNK